jgi:hypothetical protein
MLGSEQLGVALQQLFLRGRGLLVVAELREGLPQRCELAKAEIVVPAQRARRVSQTSRACDNIGLVPLTSKHCLV